MTPVDVASPGGDDDGRLTPPETTVSRLADGWEHRHADLGQLLDRACSRLAVDAGHELRQVLMIVSGELELLQRRVDHSSEVDEAFHRIGEALDRAERIVDAHLDRDEVAKMLIRVDPGPVDLSEMLRDAMMRRGLDLDGETVNARLPEASVEADPQKLDTVLDHLVERFWHARGPESRLQVSLEANDHRVLGFVGLSPSPVSRSALIEALEAPVDLESSRVDLPYARAVVERHGGKLFVDTRDSGLGLGFMLPSRGARG